MYKRQILLRDCGQVDALQQAMQKLEAALELNGRDIVTITALAQLYEKRASWFKVIDLCEPWKDEVYGRAKDTMLPMLLRAYEHTSEVLKAAEMRDRIRVYET